MDDEQDLKQVEDAPPPPFKTWNALYWLVLGNLALLVILFYLFTTFFNE